MYVRTDGQHKSYVDVAKKEGLNDDNQGQHDSDWLVNNQNC